MRDASEARLLEEAKEESGRGKKGEVTRVQTEVKVWHRLVVSEVFGFEGGELVEYGVLEHRQLGVGEAGRC